MTNDPRLNFRPAASNGSSATSNAAAFRRYLSASSAGSASLLTMKIEPEPLMSAGTAISPTRSMAASSTLASVTRTTWTLNSSPKVQPVSSYGRFCGSFGLQYW